MTTFGKRLRYLRNKRKLTMRELGEKVGLTESAIGMIERGERNPSFDKLQELSNFFEVDINYFIGQKDTSIRQPIDKDELTKADNYFYNELGYRSDDDLMESLDDQGKVSLYKRLITTGYYTRRDVDREFGIRTDEEKTDVVSMLEKIEKFYEIYLELNSKGIIEDLNKLGPEDRSMVYSLIKRLEEKNEDSNGV